MPALRRDLTAQSAQFLSRDVAVAKTRSPYGYVGGDPLNATDPGGLGSCPNGVAIPFTSLCIDNPLDFNQDRVNLQQNVEDIQGNAAASAVLRIDPFTSLAFDAVRKTNGDNVSPLSLGLDSAGAAAVFSPLLGLGGNLSKLVGPVLGDWPLAVNIWNFRRWVGSGLGAALRGLYNGLRGLSGGLACPGANQGPPVPPQPGPAPSPSTS